MTPSVWGLINKLYRTQKTADLCLRLSEISSDAIHGLVRLLGLAFYMIIQIIGFLRTEASNTLSFLVFQ